MGGSESMNRWGGGRPSTRPLEKKSLENRFRVEIFQGQLIEKKFSSITFIVWVIRRVEKNAKKQVKKRKFKKTKTNIKSDTCFYINFSRAFQKCIV